MNMMNCGNGNLTSAGSTAAVAGPNTVSYHHNYGHMMIGQSQSPMDNGMMMGQQSSGGLLQPPPPPSPYAQQQQQQQQLLVMSQQPIGQTPPTGQQMQYQQHHMGMQTAQSHGMYQQQQAPAPVQRPTPTSTPNNSNLIQSPTTATGVGANLTAQSPTMSPHNMLMSQQQQVQQSGAQQQSYYHAPQPNQHHHHHGHHHPVHQPAYGAQYNPAPTIYNQPTSQTYYMHAPQVVHHNHHPQHPHQMHPTSMQQHSIHQIAPLAPPPPPPPPPQASNMAPPPSPMYSQPTNLSPHPIPSSPSPQQMSSNQYMMSNSAPNTLGVSPAQQGQPTQQPTYHHISPHHHGMHMYPPTASTPQQQQQQPQQFHQQNHPQTNNNQSNNTNANNTSMYNPNQLMNRPMTAGPLKQAVIMNGMDGNTANVVLNPSVSASVSSVSSSPSSSGSSMPLNSINNASIPMNKSSSSSSSSSAYPPSNAYLNANAPLNHSSGPSMLPLGSNKLHNIAPPPNNMHLMMNNGQMNPMLNNVNVKPNAPVMSLMDTNNHPSMNLMPMMNDPSAPCSSSNATSSSGLIPTSAETSVNSMGKVMMANSHHHLANVNLNQNSTPTNLIANSTIMHGSNIKSGSNVNTNTPANLTDSPTATLTSKPPAITTTPTASSTTTTNTTTSSTTATTTSSSSSTTNNNNNTNSNNNINNTILLNQLNYLINLPLTADEEEILADYDCRLYGFLKLESNENIFKKYFILKAINCYEKRIKTLLNENKNLTVPKNLNNSFSSNGNCTNNNNNNSINNNNNRKSLNESTSRAECDVVEQTDNSNHISKHDLKKFNSNNIKLAKLYLSLGHLYLIIYDYIKALNSYQKFLTFKINKLKDSTFYYGLGIIYFVFGAYKYAEKSFLCALYKDAYFERANEIHFRLGLIYKELNDFEFSLKHFKLALIDSSASHSSFSKSEIKFCIAFIHELNNKHTEALEKYEELFRPCGDNSTDAATNNSTSNLAVNTATSTSGTSSSSTSSSSSSTGASSGHGTASATNPSTNTSNETSLKAKVYRQIGLLYFYSDQLNNNNNNNTTQQPAIESQPQQNNPKTVLISPFRSEFKFLLPATNEKLELNRKNLQQSIEYLIKSAQLDPNQQLTWYYLGRAFACRGSSREAFISYKNSVSSPNSNADTWCSIGVLYNQQKQSMDSLHAFVCAIQSDNRHYSSWLNLGILYEHNQQLDEAVKCYKCAILSKLFHLNRKLQLQTHDSVNSSSSSSPISTSYDILNDNIDNYEHLINEINDKSCSLMDSSTVAVTEQDKLNREEFKLLYQRVKLLDNYLASSRVNKTQTQSQNPKLPNLKEAFALDIPTDLKQRIQNLNANKNYFNFTLGLSQPSTPAKQTQLTSPPPSKKAKLTNKKDTQTVGYNLGMVGGLKPQQIQLMNQLELNRNQLSADQMQMLNQLKSQYSMMQQPHQSSIASSSGVDQLPHDLENIQPLSIDDVNMFGDILMTTNKHDIVDDLRLNESDTSHGKLFNDSNTSLSSHTNNNYLNHNGKTNSSSFSPEQIKLDAMNFTNGMSKQLSRNVNSTKIDEPNDDEQLVRKLNIRMSADEIINACKGSHGLNGIQNNCLLKPGRLRRRLLFVYKNEKELIDEKDDSTTRPPLPPPEDDEINSGDEENSDEDEDLPNENDTQAADRLNTNVETNDETLPYGSVEAQKSDSPTENGLNLNPPGPSVILENKREAHSSHLQYFCLSNPISVVRGLSNVLRLDLSLFSTKSLVEFDPDHLVEVRTQRQQPSDENWDLSGRSRTWKCESTPSFTTLLKYAKYQAHTFQEAVREEKLLVSSSSSSSSSSAAKHGHKNPATTVNHVDPASKKTFKTIKFGTNVDLSDEKKWKTHLQELAKLPAFMRVISAGNMLTHVGYKIYGVNTVQMYLKVPGCRTPGHQENNSLCSININIGPGDCEWFGVDEKYWKSVEELCERNGVDYLKGSWWPNLDELAERRVPVYRFLQKPGDLVWVNAGCVHWVQSIGWCNNISWNVGPLVYLQYRSSIERYEWNKFKFYKSIIPMMHLSWMIAKNLRITDRRLYEYIKYVLLQSLKQSQLAMNYIENCGCELKYQARQSDEPAHYCYDCECEVFNILFVSEQPLNEANKKSAAAADSTSSPPKSSQPTGQYQHVVHCQTCARKRNHLLDNFVLLNQYQLDDLKLIYDQFQLYVPSIFNLLNNDESTNSQTNIISPPTVATQTPANAPTPLLTMTS